ncbi:hypothetical protein SLEP1_g22332 [Rubroshorea leprosula]|uniref:Uncharacterized protein n=1 Tax=Rubroshorea leprosula TaxID=152421 RepID=A0AAV5J8V2_9ROSI|nr:hypothetical protein SLEP1_g22332 [Rubroshorea leprosula]
MPHVFQLLLPPDFCISRQAPKPLTPSSLEKLPRNSRSIAVLLLCPLSLLVGVKFRVFGSRESPALPPALPPNCSLVFAGKILKAKLRTAKLRTGKNERSDELEGPSHECTAFVTPWIWVLGRDKL